VYSAQLSKIYDQLMRTATFGAGHTAYSPSAKHQAATHLLGPHKDNPNAVRFSLESHLIVPEK